MYEDSRDPYAEAEYREIFEFGMRYPIPKGGYKEILPIAEAVMHAYKRDGFFSGALFELRTTLFFLLRGFHHAGDLDPSNSPEMDMLRNLVAIIRDKMRYENRGPDDRRPEEGSVQ